MCISVTPVAVTLFPPYAFAVGKTKLLLNMLVTCGIYLYDVFSLLTSNKALHLICAAHMYHTGNNCFLILDHFFWWWWW